MNPQGSIEGINILLVEDNPGDVRLTKEVLGEALALNTLHVVSDGAKALEFLSQRHAYRGSPRPDLIILDLNLPKRNGFEVLAAIKADEKLRQIPIIILSSSDSDADIVQAYDKAANCYITKPVDLDQFTEVIRSIEHFWLSIATLPRR